MIANNLQELNEMLQQLNYVSTSVSLDKNYKKIISHAQPNLAIQSQKKDNFERYVYLGHG